MQVEVGMVAPGGPCHAWQMDTDTPASGPHAQYTEVSLVQGSCGA